MWCRGIRGATLVAANAKEDILAATKELLQAIIESNQVKREAVACVFFTTTPDLNAEFPALAARQLGWTDVALMCAQEMNVPHSLSRCIRVLVLFNTEKKAEQITHVYIRGAEALRQGVESRGV
jgi:chorismate mutase